MWHYFAISFGISAGIGFGIACPLVFLGVMGLGVMGFRWR